MNTQEKLVCRVNPDTHHLECQAETPKIVLNLHKKEMKVNSDARIRDKWTS